MVYSGCDFTATSLRGAREKHKGKHVDGLMGDLTYNIGSGLLCGPCAPSPLTRLVVVAAAEAGKRSLTFLPTP